MRRLPIGLFTLALLFGGLLAVPEAQTTIRRGFTIIPNAALVLIGPTTATVGGTLTTSTTQACTSANTTETDLWSWPLPAGTLATNGRGVRITAQVGAAANANIKTVKMYFGASAVETSATLTTTPNGIGYYAQVTVLRTGAATEVTFGQHTFGSATIGNNINPIAENLANAVTIKVTGQNGVATASDLCFNGAVVEAIGTP